MPLSRPVLLALVGAILAVATFFATSAARTGESVEPTAVAPSPPKATKTEAPAKNADPLAFPKAQPVKSATIDASLVVTGTREDAGRVTLQGSFESAGPTAMPKFSLDLRVKDSKGARRAGAVSLGDSGFFTVDGKGYPIPSPAWTEVSARRAKITEFSKGATPKGETFFGLSPVSWLAGEKRKAGPKVDGTETVLLAGRLDAKRAAADFARLKASGLSSDDADFIKATHSSDLNVLVGKSDGIVRRYELSMSGREKGVRETLRLQVDLTRVNKPQRIAAPTAAGGAPSNVKKSDRKLAETLLGVGVVGIDLAGANEARKAGYRLDGTGKTAVTPKERKAIDSSGLPKRVADALAKKRVLVIFFRQSGSADDRAVASAVNAQRGRKGVSVFSDSIARLARYRAAVGQLGISQAPTVVIVGRDGQARLVEGFVDEGTLTQQVVDAR